MILDHLGPRGTRPTGGPVADFLPKPGQGGKPSAGKPSGGDLADLISAPEKEEREKAQATRRASTDGHASVHP